MNILLSGGTGYIASHTAIVLLGLGYRVVLLDNLSNSSHKILEQIEILSGTEIKFIQGDVCDTDLVEKVLIDHNIEGVIHFAGLKSAYMSNLDPLIYYQNNFFGSISLCRALKKSGVRSLIFSSSATVYGQPLYLPYDENHPVNPINVYGRTKLMVERALLDLSMSDPTWKIIVLRYFNPVGAHESGLIGEKPIGVPNNLMPYLILVAKKQLDELKIFGSDYPTRDGSAVRDYIHVMDLAEGHAAAIKFLSDTNGYEVFNLGTGKGTSVFELLSEFQEITNNLIKHRVVGRRDGDLAEYYADVSKAREILNWRATRSLRDMCLSSWKANS